MVLISDSRFKAQAAAAIIRDSCKSPVLNPSVSPVHVFTRGKVSKCAGLRTLRNINLVSVQECSIREPLNLFLCSLSCICQKVILSNAFVKLLYEVCDQTMVRARMTCLNHATSVKQGTLVWQGKLG